MKGCSSTACDLEVKSTEIALIAPTIELAKKTRKIIEERNENIEVFTSMAEKDAIDDALEIAKKLVKNGTKIIISRKGTAVAIRNAKLDVSVVVINTILSDYVESMEIAKKFDGVIAFFSYDEITDDVKSACYMLNIDAKFYTFKSDKDCESIVNEAIKDGAVLGIGGAMSQKYADMYNFDHITIENSEISIVTAIENAKQLLVVKKEELKKQNELKLQLERYQAVLNFTHDAIIAIDEKGIIDVINPIAENIVKVPPGYAMGKNINDIIDNSQMSQLLDLKEKELNQLMDINGTLVSTNRIPIMVENKIKGVVATFQDIKTIQENENKIRRTLYRKGLIAKYNFRDIKGESELLENTIEIAKSFALSDSTILIQGETGTGKELFAQSIHNMSKRKNGPFVAINCAALSKNLLESELFGYEEGAFTGAAKGGKIGLFELAHKGTIFLDEIGEIPMEIQAQLLRVLQEKEIRRVGSGVTMPVDVRVITATNKDLKKEIISKKFREDLYYRICVLELHIPPLRKRGNDVNILSKFFFEKYLGINSKEYLEQLEIIMDRVRDHKWYGNIRELQNFIERICVLLLYHKSSDNIEELLNGFLINNMLDDYNYKMRVEEGNKKTDIKNINLEQWELEEIVTTLKRNNLSIQKSAQDLGISRTTLWRKMKQYNIELK